MKKTLGMLMCVLLVLVCMGASAQDYVSVTELYEQAQAMGGVWQESFDAPNGQVTVDAPIIVPNVETMPVLTMEGAKISEELYHHIIQGRKGGRQDSIEYDEVELGGKSSEFFLGYENDYVNYKKTQIVGYDAVDTLWLQHGAYRFSQGVGKVPSAKPTTYHFPWEIDTNQPSLRGSDLTVSEAMRLWKEDIDMCFPEDDFILQPKTIEVYGSILTDQTGKGKEYRNTGHYTIRAEQMVNGVPLMGGVIGIGHDYSIMYPSTKETNRKMEKLVKKYGTGIASVLDGGGNYSRFVDETDYRTCSSLARVRSVEIADIPLAPLEDVLAGIRKEIEAGNVRHVYSVRLGYVLYSNPEMTDYAWAVPRWVISMQYITKENQAHWEREQQLNAKWGYEYAVWEEFYAEEVLVDAQSGELMIFTTGDDQTYSVPKLVTWDNAL